MPASSSIFGFVGDATGFAAMAAARLAPDRNYPTQPYLNIQPRNFEQRSLSADRRRPELCRWTKISTTPSAVASYEQHATLDFLSPSSSGADLVAFIRAFRRVSRAKRPVIPSTFQLSQAQR